MSGDVWIERRPLILASESATRRDLLESVGLHPICKSSQIDERAHHEPDPLNLCRALARAKALAVSSRHLDGVVIGADQVLSIDGHCLHKPTDVDEAMAHLRVLSGRTHYLHVAVVLAESGYVTSEFMETACMTMRALTDEAIAAYVSHVGSGQVTSSVGGYQFEGIGAHLFEATQGDHSTILGLPLLPLLALLRARGALAF